MVWWPWPASDTVPSHISSLDNPKHEGATTEILRRRYEAENHTERKDLRQAEICRGNSLPEGEIVAIVTAIQLDFIGIIIITDARVIAIRWEPQEEGMMSTAASFPSVRNQGLIDQ